MLPFLKNKMEGSVSESVETKERESDQPDEDLDSLEMAMEELFSAKSSKEKAAAFRAAVQILELEPHDEAPHG